MLNNAHNQRLMHEALGNADGEQPVAHGNARTIAAVVLIVLVGFLLSACEQPDRATIITSPADVYLVSVRSDAAATTPVPLNAAQAAMNTPLPQQQHDDAVKKAPEGNVVDMTY